MRLVTLADFKIENLKNLNIMKYLNNFKNLIFTLFLMPYNPSDNMHSIFFNCFVFLSCIVKMNPFRYPALHANL